MLICDRKDKQISNHLKENTLSGIPAANYNVRNIWKTKPENGDEKNAVRWILNCARNGMFYEKPN